MKIPLFNKLIQTGINENDPIQEKRNIKGANAITIVSTLIGILLFIIVNIAFGWEFSSTRKIIISYIILSIFILFLNKYQLKNLSRAFLSYIPVLAIMLQTVLTKLISGIETPENDFYLGRFILITIGMFPFLIYSTNEKKWFYISLIPGFISLLLFDPIHRIFGVSYYQMGFTDPSYYIVTVISVIFYVFLGISFYSFRKLSEKSEAELEKSNRLLNEKNIDLNHVKKIIEEHKEVLEIKNEDLNIKIRKATKSLQQTNDELAKHNNELREFSSVISHQLRGPIASLMGLHHLLDKESISKSNLDVLQHIEQTLDNLNVSFKELNNILDIRHEIFRINQKIILLDEINKITSQLHQEIIENNIVIHNKLGRLPSFYSNKARIRSILYNLISNAIKYRSPERPSIIEITSSEDSRYYKISIIDNGLGIDLTKHKDDVFSIFKRFHDHVPGKGLGLYLVKIQTESLGGFVDVKSEVDKFTQFDIHIRKPLDHDQQPLFESDFTSIFFNASLNSLVAFWKRDVSEDEYQQAFLKGLEFQGIYNTPSMISDISKQGPLMENARKWFNQEIIDKAKNQGLKNIVVVTKEIPNKETQEYLHRLIQMAKNADLSIRFFGTMNEAEDDILSYNTTINK